MSSTPKTLDELKEWALAHDRPVGEGWFTRFLESGGDPFGKDTDGDTILHLGALKHAANGVATVLVNAGVDIEARDWCGRTALHTATDHLNPYMVRELASLGANLNAKGSRGETPLYTAAHYRTIEMAQALLSVGADPNIKCQSEKTALHSASTAAMARLLIRSGAEVNALDSQGNTPLHDAKRKDIIKVLVDAGANPRAENAMGITPLDHNIYSKEETLRSLLPKSDKRNLLDSLKDLQTAWKPSDCKEIIGNTAQQSEPTQQKRRLM